MDTKKQKSLPSNDRLGKIVCIDKNDLTQLITDLNNNVKPKKVMDAWHKCNICGYPYPEIDLVLKDDIGFLCENCIFGIEEWGRLKEERETLRREEEKSKAGLFDKEGP